MLLLGVYLILSLVVVVKGIRAGNATRYFGNPAAALPRSWQRWLFSQSKTTSSNQRSSAFISGQ
jgi:hypothetical protein